MLKRLANFIFYGNYFYGCCTVALAAEASLQQELPFNSIYFYLLLYFGTVLFYTYAYIQEGTTAINNKRSKWYAANYFLVRRTQLLWLVCCAALAVYLLIYHFHGLQNIGVTQMLLPAVSGFAALAYYGIPVGIQSTFNLRKTGWFKPFAIGFVWATAVTYMPVLWHEVEQDTIYYFSAFNAWFLIKNFMFISLLAILFDIKDYATDHNKRLKTFVVRFGLRKTIFYVIIPLTILGLISLIIFATLLQFPLLRIIINSVPFILLVLVAWSMQRRKSILYYLVVIDGLMLVKALCGITASLMLK
ncbi:hypothetical protein FRZ67_20335 [Panacibacter ginsenosidivorans]|uniref:UbiA prenyltransferase family protein n=1 Tax=Panacibacter ginsenosidivorans TaxID=1813871 RepID=A0A5B8VDI4_9BACT|nr:hypothetical protein [Panacibacter ginsenosidivorans]QEC69534.1 hypothetical protein FRZ67_20335 [Panacibacter ginsenosidivorans]